MVSHTFPGIAPVVISTRTNDARLDKFTSGRGYTASFGMSNPAAGTNFVSIRLTNPNASGKTLYVIGLWISTSVPNTIRIDSPQTPAQAALATALTINPQTTGQAASVAASSIALNLAADPTLAVNPQTIRLNLGSPFYVALDRVLAPNSSITVTFTAGGATDLDGATLEWYEE